MYLKKFTENSLLTIDYEANGTIKTLKGKVCSFNVKEQVLSLKDQNHNAITIKLSAIRNIY
jgi:hypothetical protein